VHQAEFLDRRLVTVYDAGFPWTEQDDFFVSVVRDEPAHRVLDLGCGTGRLAVALAAAGHRVTGVDPAAASLETARRKPGADRVTWVLGTSADLPSRSFDVCLMTSHVAQLFITDEDWATALADLHRALVPGGRLVFDTRDPRARGWEHWTPERSRRHVSLPDGSTVDFWTEVDRLDGGVVHSRLRYDFSDGEKATSTIALRFRSEEKIRSSLSAAGFTVETIYGAWHREPVGHPDGELLVLARAGAWGCRHRALRTNRSPSSAMKR